MNAQKRMEEVRKGRKLLAAARAYAKKHGHRMKRREGWIISRTGVPIAVTWQAYAAWARKQGWIERRGDKYVDHYTKAVLS